jgi:hypothetical protein
MNDCRNSILPALTKLLKSAALITATCTLASAAIIFSDNFDDGDVSDWSKVTNYVPGNGSTNLGVDPSVNVSAPDSLETFLLLPGGDPTIHNIFVRASHSFTTSDAGDHVLTLSAMSAPCSGCTISYEVFVDGSSVVMDNDLSFQSLLFTLSGLAPGGHTLTLGMFTDTASQGRFSAWFDDVSISGPEASAVPEPSTMNLLFGGLALLILGRQYLSRREAALLNRVCYLLDLRRSRIWRSAGDRATRAQSSTVASW